MERVSRVEIGDKAFANDVQQAVEKYLKAAISWGGTAYPFTHDIAKLLDAAERAGLSLPAIDRDIAESLTVFAGAERYETFRPDTTLDRRAFVKLMQAIEAWVDGLVRD